MDNSFANYICGLVDGEGYFGILRPSAHNYSRRVNCQFIIRLRKDDRHILEKIKEFLSVGHIAEDNNMISYRVLKHQEQLVLVDFFDKYKLRAKKRKDYTYWRLAVLEQNKRPKDRDMQYLGRLCDKGHKIKG